MKIPRVLALLALAVPLVAAAGVESIAPRDSVDGLKTALNQGATRAVAQLGVTDGFLRNPKVRIPLPPTLKKADKALRMVGMGDEADELVVAMNRAAEAAVPEAKTLLVDAVRQMTLADAREILTGGDDAATKYFRKVSYDKLEQRFLPVVKRTTDKAQLAAQYNQLAGQAAQLGLVSARDANVEGYVTRKALDGLFFVIAEEERAIRKDPLGQSSRILRGVFGALGQ
ncbi:MAG: DUF4197 domain-containing protein [Steroidobacteraceae bacterium]